MRLSLGGTLAGLGICGMHYLGQAGIVNYDCVYTVAYVIGAAIIAVGAQYWSSWSILPFPLLVGYLLVEVSALFCPACGCCLWDALACFGWNAGSLEEGRS
jgi:NO-binding membrane sensor protein with MHYT domain